MIITLKSINKMRNDYYIIDMMQNIIAAIQNINCWKYWIRYNAFYDVLKYFILCLLILE
jgi:hypothetical protein